jgi:hypothetical protein
MSFTHAILRFFGVHVPEPVQTPAYAHRKYVLNELLKTEEPIAEVDNERDRYTAARYIAHLKACELGDRRGFKEWSQRLLKMRQESPDDYEVFFRQVDELIEAGEWHTVLTPADKVIAAENARAKRFEIIEGLERSGPSGLPMSIANRMASTTHVVEYPALLDTCQDQPTADEMMGLPPWPDLGDDEAEPEGNIRDEHDWGDDGHCKRCECAQARPEEFCSERDPWDDVNHEWTGNVEGETDGEEDKEDGEDDQDGHAFQRQES